MLHFLFYISYFFKVTQVHVDLFTSQMIGTSDGGDVLFMSADKTIAGAPFHSKVVA